MTVAGKLITSLGLAIGMMWFGTPAQGPRGTEQTDARRACNSRLRVVRVSGAAMPITIVGSAFEAEWQRRNMRLVAEALQADLLEQDLMTHDLHQRFREIDEDGSGELDEVEFSRFVHSTPLLKRLSPSQVHGARPSG